MSRSKSRGAKAQGPRQPNVISPAVERALMDAYDRECAECGGDDGVRVVMVSELMGTSTPNLEPNCIPCRTSFRRRVVDVRRTG